MSIIMSKEEIKNTHFDFEKEMHLLALEREEWRRGQQEKLKQIEDEREELRLKHLEAMKKIEDEAEMNRQLIRSQNLEVCSQRHSVRLPPIKISRFSGNKLKWVAFNSLFTAIVDRKPLSDIEKFSRLKKLLVGEAAKSIAHLEFIPENYRIAYELLRQNFDDPQFVTDNSIRNFFKIKPPGLTVAQLSHFQCAIEGALSGLRSQKVDVDSYLKYSIFIWDSLPNVIKFELNKIKGSAPWNSCLLTEKLDFFIQRLRFLNIEKFPDAQVNVDWPVEFEIEHSSCVDSMQVEEAPLIEKIEATGKNSLDLGLDSGLGSACQESTSLCSKEIDSEASSDDLLEGKMSSVESVGLEPNTTSSVPSSAPIAQTLVSSPPIVSTLPEKGVVEHLGSEDSLQSDPIVQNCVDEKRQEVTSLKHPSCGRYMSEKTLPVCPAWIGKRSLKSGSPSLVEKPIEGRRSFSVTSRFDKRLRLLYQRRIPVYLICRKFRVTGLGTICPSNMDLKIRQPLVCVSHSADYNLFKNRGFVARNFTHAQGENQRSAGKIQYPPFMSKTTSPVVWTIGLCIKYAEWLKKRRKVYFA